MCFELFFFPFSFPSRGCESGRLLSSISVLVTNTNDLGLLCAGFFSVPPVQIRLLVLFFPDCGGERVLTSADLS